MNVITKKALIKALKDIRNKGWIPNARHGNAGGVGNTLEDLLGIEENNLPIPNAAEWELKCQRSGSASLTTLFHMEPSPRAIRFVPAVLLPKYGWAHQQAGDRYPQGEMSFRQTINGLSRTDRGFGIVIDRESRKVVVSFDSKRVDKSHGIWLETVKTKINLGELDPQPYWGFNDLFHKAGTKLLNCFYIQAEVRKVEEKEEFYYSNILMLQSFSFDNFLNAIENGDVLIDFDARTGHNHGTKFRLRQNAFTSLYEEVTEI
ncbi:MAG: MvaI/BcnI family restriction endonuclease [candidate division Zixibacteria bacterium]|nr:MvaI/BcnI family restriction endonuclease [candidate division Zixibacteria bacterium]